MCFKYCKGNDKLFKLIRDRNGENKIEILSSIRKCKEWNDKSFVTKLMESYFEHRTDNLESQIVPEVFFSLFMHDWYDHEPNQEYGILEKVQLFCKADSSLDNVGVDPASQHKVERKPNSEQTNESNLLPTSENMSGSQLNGPNEADVKPKDEFELKNFTTVNKSIKIESSSTALAANQSIAAVTGPVGVPVNPENQSAASGSELEEVKDDPANINTAAVTGLDVGVPDSVEPSETDQLIGFPLVLSSSPQSNSKTGEKTEVPVVSPIEELPTTSQSDQMSAARGASTVVPQSCSFRNNNTSSNENNDGSEENNNHRHTNTDDSKAGSEYELFYAKLINIFTDNKNSHYHFIFLKVVCLLMADLEKHKDSELNRLREECRIKEADVDSEEMTKDEKTKLKKPILEDTKKSELAAKKEYQDELKHILKAFSAAGLNEKLKRNVLKMVLAFGAQYNDVTEFVLNEEQFISLLRLYNSWTCPDHDDNVTVAENDDAQLMDLCRCLIDKKVVKFRKNLLKYIADAKMKYGDCFYEPIHLHITIAFIVAKKLKLNQTLAFITQEFPYIGLNSTILLSLDRGLEFRRFKVFELNNKTFDLWVRCNHLDFGFSIFSSIACFCNTHRCLIPIKK